MTMLSGAIDFFAVLGFVYTVIGVPGLIFLLLALDNAEEGE